MIFYENTKKTLQLKFVYKHLNRWMAIQTQQVVRDNHQHAVPRPFSDLPGPKYRELLRSFLPGGQFYNKSIYDVAIGMRKKYGNICLMRGLLGRSDLVLCFNPADFEKIMRNEGPWPFRKGFEQISYFRKHYKKDFFDDNQGLLLDQHETWFKLRSAVNPIMMKPNSMISCIKPFADLNQEFVKRIADIRDPLTLEVSGNFEEELSRLIFENVSFVALNKEFGLIRKNRDNPEALKLLRNMRRLFELVYQLDVEPSIWKIIGTPKYYESMRIQTEIFDVLRKFVFEALERHEQKKNTGRVETETQSIFDKLIAIDRKTAIIMAMDMIIAGVDTTLAALIAILLALAKHPQKQQKLRDEILKILPSKDSLLTEENMKNLPYLRAVIKEGMRFYPNLLGTYRKLNGDLDLGGYKIPAGTTLQLCSNLLAKDEEYYAKPNEYIPERWLRAANNKKAYINPFTFMPFGFGARMCVGKRIVDLELEMTVATLIRNYYIEFKYSADDPFETYFENVPKIPLKFKFSDVSL